MHKWSKYSLTSENIGIYEEIFENVKIVDCHAHVGRDKDGHSMTADKLIRLMDKANINKSIIFPLNELNANFTQANNNILLAHKFYKDRFIPFFRLDPNISWKDEFKLRVEQGFKGIKLHPRSQNFAVTSAKVMEVYEEAEKSGLAIMMHTGFGLENVGDDINTICKTFPKLKFIIGHSGFVDIDNVIKKAGKKDNVIFDISTIKMFDLFDLLRKVDYNKIAFGSDAPYYDIDLALECLVDAAITVDKTAYQIKKILGGNISRWFH